jgi:hypothetical protein
MQFFFYGKSEAVATEEEGGMSGCRYKYVNGWVGCVRVSV